MKPNTIFSSSSTLYTVKKKNLHSYQTQHFFILISVRPLPPPRSLLNFKWPPCLFYLLLIYLLLPRIPQPTTTSSFLHHRQWCLVNIALMHSSLKCHHYGYQMHLWLFRSIDWHNQYVIQGKFGDTTLGLPDALTALSSNLYGDGS